MRALRARYGPLPPLLLLLTATTGVVDAVSYLRFDHSFVANMTGNVVFIGFAIAGATGVSLRATIIALAAFLLGAFAGGRLARVHAHRGRLLTVTVILEAALLGAACIVAFAVGDRFEAVTRDISIVLLALATGMQNAVARKLAVPDMNTTVLTLTLTAIASEGPTPARIGSVLAMLVGAFCGGVLVLHVGTAAALLLALVLLMFATLRTAGTWAVVEPWTQVNVT